MVKISEVRAGAGNVTIEGEIVAKEEPRDVVSKFGKRLRVCSATIQDDSGSMTLSLWNDDIEKVNVGDKVQIADGWVTEFKQQPQISAGKNGKITIMGK
ncbi:Single-stranded DNA binding protein Ssb [uncultured archaeon]|nr:Single-stranded DNA binding protein Ssb [uncultured archaeon]